MIRLTRMNGEELHISALQIETIEPKPDTLLTLVSGRQMYVREKVDEVRAAMLAWFREIQRERDGG